MARGAWGVDHGLRTLEKPPGGLGPEGLGFGVQGLGFRV